MAKNRVFEGTKPAISLPVPAGTKSGDPVKSGNYVGVAETDRADSTVNPPTLASVAGNSSGNPDGYASVNIDGAFLLTVTGAITAPGTPIYIAGDGTLSTTAAGGTLFGESDAGRNAQYATKSAAAGPAVVRIVAQV